MTPFDATSLDHQPGATTELIDHVARLLPQQAPLHAFVHHNTLHAFEHLPFTVAVETAGRQFGAEPYLPEAAYHRLRADGRITPADLAAVATGSGAPGADLRHGGADYVLRRLALDLDLPAGPALSWTLHETDALTRLHPQVDAVRRRHLLASGAERDLLTDLWARLRAVPVPTDPPTPRPARPRDRILEATGHDPDRLTHPLLIRFTAAYLDQGIAHWAMPGRDAGMLAAFHNLYGASRPVEPFLRDLPALVIDHTTAGRQAVDVVEWALDALGVLPGQRAAVIEATLLSLRGWAGMVHHLHRRPDRAPVSAPPARLTDYLAIQLTLDTLAARHITRQTLGPGATPADTDLLLAHHDRDDLGLRYEAFVLAQLMPVDVTALADPGVAARWLRTVAGCPELTRRRLLHLAYERRHAVTVLDALSAHQPDVGPPRAPAPAQVVFCIDEREESVRRHLEELSPAVETFGYAGFFGVPMTYQGLDDVRPRPLCPVVIQPRHIVREVADVQASDWWARRRAMGSWRFDVGSRTLARGAAASLVGGPLHLAPLLGRTLFPRAYHRWERRATGRQRPTTGRLALEFDHDEGWVGPQPGFTVAEMADIVAAFLRTTGLAGRLGPLVVVIGHGSASSNNPHEAAHDCGATGGGRGGPNARAFAAMANHPQVRRELAARGLPIPATTWFLGGYHNTCDDGLAYYDEELVPAASREAVARVRTDLAAACAHSAQERCRRFADTPDHPTPEAALRHVERHTVDLGQPRPEYGHATNAVAVVGRRWRTRGLFLDRRAFLISYDPTTDADGTVLTGLLMAVGPVCAGINLEYYFSHVDPTGYGCGTKLPHNISGLLGVMDGQASDLRTGLPWQMVEIHEPVRLLLVCEAEPRQLASILDAQPDLRRLVVNGWIRLVAWSPTDNRMCQWRDDGFVAYRPESTRLDRVTRSADAYVGRRDPINPVQVIAGVAR
ncbi:DUF2309 domain-containing protein [Pilimelia columellifera]|uniref:Probable inorganic carbon transporter subunit DabA n=1 Tax=Pilimelia columellifera subsp. columellifera TaxID=706583 RepID=A0ABN3NKS3_9ACTN